MSFLIGQFPLQSFKLGAGQAPSMLAIGDCTKMIKAPGTVAVPINWADYGGAVGASCLIEVDLSILGPANPLDKIRSVYIDNTFSDQDVFVYFPDTQFTMICPANSVVMAPAWTNGLKAQLFASGFLNFTVPSTTFHFSNVPKDTPTVITSASIIQKSIYMPTLSAELNAAGPAVNHGALDFGLFSPFATHYLLMFTAQNAVAAARPVTGFTVNGTPGVLFDSTNIAQGVTMALGRVNGNFSGQSPTVIVTYSAGDGGSLRRVAVLTAYNLSDPAGIFNSTVDIVNPPVFNLLTPSDGIAIAMGYRNAAAPATMTGIANLTAFTMDTAAQPINGYVFGFQVTNGSPLPILLGVAGRIIALSAQ